jgi:alanyl-tRNA synthetase
LRIVLRRIIGTMQRLGLNLDVNEMIDMHIDYLKTTYPELEEKREDVKTIIEIESKRYEESKIRMKKIATNLKEKKHVLNVDDLIRMYESDGITPDYLKELEVIPEIPPTFYSKLSDLHQAVDTKQKEKLPLENTAETELLFYGDDPHEFEARVLGSFDKYVVLDKTSFYARGGGQEPDHGKIAGFEVVDVNKHGNVIVHELKGGIPKEGETVSCKIDSKRRDGITKHHTSTHILNSSARNVLGSWVWQNSAFKEEDHARLDITHHSALTKEEERKIADLANKIIEQNKTVSIENYDRGTAEQKYGFRIYQGGVVPVKSVRIVSIEDFDIEACGGTHVKKTKEIDLIRIERTKRIQDGVVRIEFKAGKAAREYDKQQEIIFSENKIKEEQKKKHEVSRKEEKEHWKSEIPILVNDIFDHIKKGEKDFSVGAIVVKKNDDGSICVSNIDEEFQNMDYHIKLGEKLTQTSENVVYCGMFDTGIDMKYTIFGGGIANAQEIGKEVDAIIDGSGGGHPKLVRGAGKNKSKKGEAIKKVEQMVLE